MRDPDAEAARNGPSPAPALVVVSPDGEELAAVPLATEPIWIGRWPDNDVILDPDPERALLGRDSIVRVACTKSHRSVNSWSYHRLCGASYQAHTSGP